MVTQGTVFGSSLYGQSTYGYYFPISFSSDPFTAQPLNYNTISLSWSQPAGEFYAWRLVKNMSGFPVDQDDGVLLIDYTAGYPGNGYTDTSVTPGSYHYYSLFVKISTDDDIWAKTGIAGCLMLNSYGSGSQMLNLIPSFYINAASDNNELEADPTGNLYLNSFMSVFGWGMDYLRTQYDTYLNINNPLTVPLNDLYNLAIQLGIDINPAISPYTLRKALYYNAAVNQEKGTLSGIAAEISTLTGWFADLTIGINLLLDNDQSFFETPVYQTWSPYLTYNISPAERVLYGSYIYSCISSENYGNAPTGINAENTWWQPVPSETSSVLVNSATGGIDTWEGIYVNTPNTVLPDNALLEMISVSDPLNPPDNTFNWLYLQNIGSTTDMWLRSVSRLTSEIATTVNPDPYQVIADGIPVPSILSATEWSSSTQYAPQDTVVYSNQPFLALRASLDSVPPYATPGSSNLDWAPLGFDERFRFAEFGYMSVNQLNAIPFVEWYDASGDFIARVFSRNNGTSPSLPPSICYDSFVTGSGQELAVYTDTDDGNYNWTTQTGNFSVSPYAGGCCIPSNESTRSIVTVDSGSANCQVGLTFVSPPVDSYTTGLVLRWASDTSYLRADMTSLSQNNGGTVTVLGTYSTPCNVGDRILVNMFGSSVNVFRNNLVVLSVTSSFNSTSTVNGIVYEQSTDEEADYYIDEYSDIYGGDPSTGPGDSSEYTAYYGTDY